MVIVDSFKLVHWVFFTPFKLNDELREVGPYLATNVPIWDVRNDLSADERHVAVRALLAVTLGAVVWPIIGGLGALGLGHSLRWANMLFVALTSLLLGVTGLLWVGISFGVNMGSAISLAGSLVAIIGFDPALSLIQDSQTSQMIQVAAFGLGSGLVTGLILGLAALAVFTAHPSARWLGGICTVGSGLACGSLFAWTGGGDPEKLVAGVILCASFAPGFLCGYFVGYWRLAFYLVELTWQLGLSGLSFLAVKIGDSGRLTRRLYQLSPVHQDELIWFPLWTLDRQLKWLAHGDRSFALEAIVKLAGSFRQGWAAEATLATLLARDLRDCQSIPNIVEAIARLGWFPHAVDLPLPDMRDIGTLLNEVRQNIEADEHTLTAHGKQTSLRKAQTNLETLQETLDQMQRRVASPLLPIVQRWKKIIAQASIENFYIAGNPIQPQQEQVFVGREDLFDEITGYLTATQKPPLLLYGQNRTGKTSVLLQLSNRLPIDHYVPIYVDLQAVVPATSNERFLYTLACEAARWAQERLGISLPAKDWNESDEWNRQTFYNWLEQVRQFLGERLLLLALDECERIEEMPDKGWILGVLRHLTEQYSHWLVLILAGVHTRGRKGHGGFADFTNLQTLHVSYLDLKAARKLIQLPAESYQIDYDERAVEVILKATHAQPFLVQTVCFKLIQSLKSRMRYGKEPAFQVTVDDAQDAIRQAVDSGRLYFQGQWDDSDDLEKRVLAELGYGHDKREWIPIGDLRKNIESTPRELKMAIDNLKQRELIDITKSECQLQVPMLGQWIQNEVSLAALRGVSLSPLDPAQEPGQE